MCQVVAFDSDPTDAHTLLSLGPGVSHVRKRQVLLALRLGVEVGELHRGPGVRPARSRMNSRIRE